MAPGPTPTFTMSAPASTRSRDAFGGGDVAGHDGDARLQGADEPEHVERALLVAVRGVDDEHVDAGVEERLGLASRRRR